MIHLSVIHLSGHKIQTIASASLLAGAIATAGAATPALGQSASAQAAGKAVSVKCRGGASSCKAVVSLAGGASRETLKIALTDTNLKLMRVVAKPSSVKGAYQLYGGKYSLGGSLYTVKLNAVQSIPKGSTLTLTFAVPRRAHAA